jgi:hypothetical protein
MNQYHYYLNLPVEFKPDPVDMSTTHHALYPLDRLTKEFAEWFWQFNIAIGHGEQFLLQPGKQDFHIIHTDDFGTDPIVKLNYVYCDTPHSMNWYELKPGIELTKAYSPAGTPYGACTLEECNKVYSAQCGQPSLVNVMELHDVSKVSSPRTCYSLVLIHRRNPPKRLSWVEAVEIFKDYIVEIK